MACLLGFIPSEVQSIIDENSICVLGSVEWAILLERLTIKTHFLCLDFTNN